MLRLFCLPQPCPLKNERVITFHGQLPLRYTDSSFRRECGGADT